MLSVHLNWLAVLAAAVVNMVVGAAWYSPMLFGKEWSKLLGKKMSDMQANAGPGYTVSTIGALVSSYVLAVLVANLAITTAVTGAFLGLLVWVGFTAAATAPDTVFAGRPWKLWQINTGYYLVVLLINGALLATWR